MPSWTLFALILAAVWPLPAAAQSEHPRENTVAIGGGVGFLASDNGTPDVAQTLQATTGNVDGFFEYYYTPRASLRVSTDGHLQNSNRRSEVRSAASI
jgi:hypothetical protein